MAKFKPKPGKPGTTTKYRNVVVRRKSGKGGWLSYTPQGKRMMQVIGLCNKYGRDVQFMEWPDGDRVLADADLHW